MLHWVWHRKSKGPVGLPKKPPKGLNPTQAVVPYLLQQLPPQQKYHVWLDNLFTSHNLLVHLREQGWGAAGTCKANSGVHKSLIEIKKKEQTKDIYPWGYMAKEISPDSKVIQFGVKDNAFVLFQSTIHTGM